MARPTLKIIPSTDTAFGEHVERLVARHAIQTAPALAARLQRLFPRVVVRPSEVSGQSDTWYVYRDGVWRSSMDASWWEEPRTPRVVVTREGWIEEANPAARAILGLSASDPMPRFFSDFSAPGTLDDATALFDVVAAGNELDATTLVRPTSGDVIACDLHVRLEGDRLIGSFRLAEDIPVQSVGTSVPAVRLECRPASDVLFARYAEEALGRMPEPTPDGLALRLRRLYPHARVDGQDSVWRVERDGGHLHDASREWWRDDGLAAVRYDRQGRITSANAPAEALLGAGLVGRHWQEMVTPGTTDQVAAVLRLIAEVGWAESRFRMPGPDGYLFEFDSYTEVSDDMFETIMRPRPDDPASIGLAG